jgi:hypothetical protein
MKKFLVILVKTILTFGYMQTKQENDDREM